MRLGNPGFALLIASLLGAGSAMPVAAGSGPVNAVADASGGGRGDVATLALAYELLALGRESGDALVVLVAARMAAGVETAPGSDATLTPGGPDTRDALLPPPTAEEMFKLAAELAAGDAAMLAMIADQQAEVSRGAIGGVKQWASRIGSGYTDVWEIAFEGSAPAEVAIIGDGQSNLDMVLTDENGNVLCFESSPDDQAYCDFVPAWDGNFYVSVENTGNDRNTYYLVTN